MLAQSFFSKPQMTFTDWNFIGLFGYLVPKGL
jgi:hypothetical protein